MQQPVALLKQRLETLAEFVFVDIWKVLQHLLNGDQFIPEPLRFQIADELPAVRLSIGPGGFALALELRQLSAAPPQPL